MSYRKDREFSDCVIPQIKRIVGPLLLDEAPIDLDCKQATDLFVFTARDMRIAARVRRPGYAEKYPHDFTIRLHRDSGARTELEKIVDGWGDWLFYGHVDDAHAIQKWMVIDLASFRAGLIRSATNGTKLVWRDKANGDGTYFRAFDVRSFPLRPPLLIAQSEDLTQYEWHDDFARSLETNSDAGWTPK